MTIDWLVSTIDSIARLFPSSSWLAYSFNVRALIVIALVSLICGAVGSLVVGNRMAFFSDALAHCAFAGVTLGMLFALNLGQAADDHWIVPLTMVAFGVLVGIAIAFVKENSALASDTIIGVFFAFSVGFGGMMLQALSRSTYSNPESFMFGNVLFVFEDEVLILFALALGLAAVMAIAYNSLVFASFNPSLARSRGIRVRSWNYVFIVMLALIVNLCLRPVGALLINALLIVPAATAANIGRNARQMFWIAILVSLLCGELGLWLSNVVQVPVRRGDPIHLQTAGTIVVLCVAAFIASLAFRIAKDRRIQTA